MKKLLFVLVALILVVGLANAQTITREYYFRVPTVQNETDTIPGTQTGGIGAGGAGWLFIGTDDVEYSLMSQDSSLLTITFDYADSGYASATGSSAKSIGFKTRTRVIGEDSLSGAAAGGANPKTMISAILRARGAATTGLEGARYIRARILGVNTAVHAGAASGRTVSLRIRCLKNN